MRLHIKLFVFRGFLVGNDIRAIPRAGSMKPLSLVVIAVLALVVVGCIYVRNAGLCERSEHVLGSGALVQPLWTKSKVYIPKDGLDPTLVGLSPYLFLINVDASTGEPRMSAYNVLTGGELWTQPAALGDSLLTTDNAVYKGGVDKIEEYDPRTGHRRRTVGIPSVRSIDLLNWIGDSIFAFAPGSGRSLIYNIKAGKANVSEPLIPYIPFVIEHNILYLADAEGFSAKDNITGKILWTYPVHEPVTLHALFTRDLVILRASSGNIYALNRATGKLGWQLLGTHSISNLAQDETNVYYLTSEGYLDVIGKGTGNEIQHLRLSNTPFAIEPPEAAIGSYDIWVNAPDQLLVGSLGDSCQLFAIGLPK